MSNSRSEVTLRSNVIPSATEESPSGNLKIFNLMPQSSTSVSFFKATPLYDQYKNSRIQGIQQVNLENASKKRPPEIGSDSPGAKNLKATHSEENNVDNEIIFQRGTITVSKAAACQFIISNVLHLPKIVEEIIDGNPGICDGIDAIEKTELQTFLPKLAKTPCGLFGKIVPAIKDKDVLGYLLNCLKQNAAATRRKKKFHITLVENKISDLTSSQKNLTDRSVNSVAPLNIANADGNSLAVKIFNRDLEKLRNNFYNAGLDVDFLNHLREACYSKNVIASFLETIPFDSHKKYSLLSSRVNMIYQYLGERDCLIEDYVNSLEKESAALSLPLTDFFDKKLEMNRTENQKNEITENYFKLPC